ncbi:MAG: penicillin-binding protein activator LpoB [bacterium]
MKTAILVLMIGLLSLAGCSSSRQVERLDPAGTTDLSGKWNETDARLVAEEMIDDCIKRPWLTNFVAAAGEMPVVTVGNIRNKTSEHIDTEIFTTDFERELLNSGKVRFVAAPEERNDVREERMDQDYWASSETRKQLREEIGADFILLGSVKTITDQIEGKSTIFYQTDLELINVETSEKVWIGTKKIKKGISQGKVDW